MANKKMTKFGVLSLLALLGLTGCSSSDVIAKPTDYSDQILVSDDTIYNNEREIIYDAIREGSLASDVLDKVLYQYAISTLGRYNEVIPELSTNAKDAEGINITLKAAAKDAYNLGSNHEVVRKFIKAHKAYWSTNENGEHVDDDGKVLADGESTTKDSKEIARVKAKWTTIEQRIAEAMYSAISGGSYSYRNKFEEKKFLVSLRKDLKVVEDYNTLTVNDTDKTTTGYYSAQILNPDVDKDEVFDYFLHRANYQSHYALGDVESANDKATYIEDEIIPTIYRTLLVEQYLFDETYNTLGRAYAREVNLITLASNSEYPKAAEYLMREFVTRVISAAPNATTLADATNTIDEEDFEMISNIFKGVGLDTATGVAGEIRDALVAKNAIIKDDTSVAGETFYKGTEYGEMMEDYSKIDANPLLTDSSIESSFTGSGAYTVEVGKEIKTDEVRLKNHVTKGWFVKNGNLSASSDITSRLFSVGVANALNTDDSADRFYYEGGQWKYDSARDTNKYVARINGSYFLKVASTESHDGTDPVASANDILFESDGTYYVVQIKEAANSAKLSKKSPIYDDDLRMEEYVNEIAKVLSGNSTYESLAKKHWVSKMDVVYHDTVVYNYFKSNFPELFD